ncbi:MAG TPA: TOBE domain-containing protein, partial [Nitrososphaera sp.]|nr:TOBE domain-containing protein [Nitrososphaera sp.]
KQLRQLITSLGMTAVFVTHDQEEAFALSDRIALLSKGVCQQVGTAHDLYRSPVNEFVARFIGKSNILSLPFKGYGKDCLFFSLPSGNELRVPNNRNLRLRPGEIYRLLLRPEAIEFEQSPVNTRLFEAKIRSEHFAGAFSEYELEGEGLNLLARQPSLPQTKTFRVGENLEVHASPKAIYFFPSGPEAKREPH